MYPPFCDERQLSTHNTQSRLRIPDLAWVGQLEILGFGHGGSGLEEGRCRSCGGTHRPRERADCCDAPGEHSGEV